LKRTITALGLAFALLFGFGMSPASAGNLTSNFYLKNNCGINMSRLGTWAALAASNYDNGANFQTYHTAVTRSGVGIIVDGIYVDGINKGTGLEKYITVAGHGRHTLKLKVHHFDNGSLFYTCSFVL
jgi:hypothetical protein